MRGRQDSQVSMLAFVDLETRVPSDHPLRTIKRFADDALARLSPVFDELYAEDGRASIPPERLLKASLLMSLYSVRSERAFCEELDYHLLFRWFLGMSVVEPSSARITNTAAEAQKLDQSQQPVDVVPYDRTPATATAEGDGEAIGMTIVRRTVGIAV